MIKYLLCLPTILLWGLNPILTRLCSDKIGIIPYMLVTTFISCMSTIVISSLFYHSVWGKIKDELFCFHDDITKRWLIIATDSILCLCLPMIFYNLLLSDTSSIAIVVTTTWYGAPLITTVLSIVIFGQSISKLQIVGLFVCLGGIVMINIDEILFYVRTRHYQPL